MSSKVTQLDLERRINSLAKWGDFIRSMDDKLLKKLALDAEHVNPWFTFESVSKSLMGISKFLDVDKLKQWVANYDFHQAGPRTVGIIMAGNIPLVGFHDLLCVLISGNSAQVKLSSKDSRLLTFLIEELLRIEPSFTDCITIQQGALKGYDVIIATGSDNSALQFEYYFSKYPHIIRRNRTSCAILTGNETAGELACLGDDIFTYFGLGCRNVSKLYVPNGFNLNILLTKWDDHKGIIHHHKYANNYDYQKSILLVNQQPFHDNGFILLQESEKLVSPIAVLYFEYYSDVKSLENTININMHKLQCVVGTQGPATIPFGQAQYPEVWDYADGVDTLQFLSSLH